MSEGNGAQVNRSSGEYGSGSIGRLGVLGQAFIRDFAVVAKIDPITEQLERGPNGLCVQVSVKCHSCTDNKAANGEMGELLFRIDTSGTDDAGRAFQGYYGNENATNKKVARDVLAKDDYFFRTGDVVRCEGDGFRRYTFFEDRIGDTFRWKGENVSTMVLTSIFGVNLQEVSAVIGAYPGIDDANVYGIRLPNHDGRAGCAAITIHRNSPPDFCSLAQHLKAVLPRYAVPLFLRVTDSMRLTGNMKHQKHEMREEGVDPEKCQKEKILWFKNGDYVEFTKDDWEGLKAGQVKL